MRDASEARRKQWVEPAQGARLKNARRHLRRPDHHASEHSLRRLWQEKQIERKPDHDVRASATIMGSWRWLMLAAP